MNGGCVNLVINVHSVSIKTLLQVGICCLDGGMLYVEFITIFFH